jgi:hypothetical protein
MEKPEKKHKGLFVKIFFTACVAVLFFFHVFFPDIIPSDTLTIGLLIAVILPWISTFVASAEFPGGWKIQFRKIEQEQRKQKDEIKSLRFLMSYFITPFELIHLEKLRKDGPFLYKSRKRFILELKRLRDLGFISKTSKVGLSNIPKEDDLKKYVSITERGIEYLELRSRMMS